MFKFCLVLALTVVSAVAAQEAPNADAAPEPYSYGYSTDTHSAQEQRSPDGKVTGSYMLVGDDGRERRVEYTADESGFHAKVATNEVGTKSESPADVELIASEPTPAQYAYLPQAAPVPPQVQYAPVRQQVQQVQRVAIVQQPAAYRQVSSSYYQYPQTSGYGYGYGYYPGAYGYGVNNGYSTTGYNRGYGYGAPVYSGSGLVNVGNYNNHLPSQYYRSVSSSSTVGAPATVGGYRYVNQPAGVTTTSVRTVGVPTTSNLGGSSNYLVVQKRDAEENKAKSS